MLGNEGGTVRVGRLLCKMAGCPSLAGKPHQKPQLPPLYTHIRSPPPPPPCETSCFTVAMPMLQGVPTQQQQQQLEARRQQQQLAGALQQQRRQQQRQQQRARSRTSC